MIALFVVVVFATLITPYLGTNTPHRRTTCLSHVKHLALAQILYSSDEDDRFPPSRLWMDAVSPYTHSRSSVVVDPEFFHCPSLDKGQHGYAMEDGLSEVKQTGIKAPSRAVLIYESRNTGWNAHGSVTTDLAEPRHYGKSYFGFADGHVLAGASLADVLTQPMLFRRHRPSHSKPGRP